MKAYNQTNPLSYIKALHRQTDGYITLFKKLADNKVAQYHYKLDKLNDETLSSWVTFDSYVSLNSFHRPIRGNDRLRTIHNLYIDLDTYNTPYTNEQILMHLEHDYFGQSIPEPNMILYSGRGMGLIWNIEPISGLAIEKFNVVQHALYELLKPFGADQNALDAARVFRLPASVNSKSNEIVRYDMLHDDEYTLQQVATEFIGIGFTERKKATPKPATQKRKSHSVVNYLFTPYSLAKARLDDLEKLIRLRGGKMCGNRERILFLARYFSMRINGGNEQAAIQKIEYLNGLFSVPLSESELLKATYSAVTYVKENKCIKLKNEKLIEWLSITPEEQQELSTIIGKSEKLERDRVRKERTRRAAGSQTMEQYNAKRLQALIRTAKRLKLIVSMYPLHSVRELAERAGFSKSHVANLLKRMDELLALDAQMSRENKLCGLSGEVSTDASAYVKRECAALSGEREIHGTTNHLVDQIRRMDRIMKELRVT